MTCPSSLFLVAGTRRTLPWSPDEYFSIMRSISALLSIVFSVPVMRFTRWVASNIRVGLAKMTLGLMREATSRTLSNGEALNDPIMWFLRKAADRLCGAIDERDVETKEDQTHLSKPCSNKSTSAWTGVSAFTAVACTISQSFTRGSVHSDGNWTSVPTVALPSTDWYLYTSCQPFSNRIPRIGRISYNASISGSYSFIVAFFNTVPFPARSMGLSVLVTRIISLKIRLKFGASLFASSTSDLYQSSGTR